MTTSRDQEEQDLRTDQMTVNIEKMRADLQWEAKKFLLQAVIATAAAMSAGAALLAIVLHLTGRL